MKTKINPPAASKINWTAGITLLVGILIYFDIIPESMREQAVEGLLFVPPLAIMVFRTFFTEPDEIRAG